MTKLFGIVVMAALAAGGYWLLSNPSSAAPVEAVQLTQADVEAVLTTNGRIEAAERYDVRSDASGRVVSVAVELGQSVRQDQTIATLKAGSAPVEAMRAEAERAQARLEGAKAGLRAVEQALPPSERRDIEARIESVEAAIEAFQSDRKSTQRLVERQAVPRVELETLDSKIRALQDDRAALLRQLNSQAGPAELERAQAAVREAEAAVRLAQSGLADAVIPAPSAGRVYALPVRPGDYLTPGAPVASIAAGERVEAVILVDEPELGRVQLGAEAQLTADAYPERRWRCTVERLPTVILEVDNRRVGEILCSVSGDAAGLIPNLTVDVAIRTAFAEHVPSLPRGAVQRGASGEFVWVVDAESTVRPVAVETGVRGADRVEILSGLDAGASVVLPAGRDLQAGDEVTVLEPLQP